jgi:hypothetical protein
MTLKEVIKNLLTFKNTLKMFHWRAKNYNKHKISNGLGDKIDELIDKFVEVLIGSRKERPEFPLDLKLKMVTDDELEQYLESFREWLTEKLPEMLENYETELMNIKDEMIAEVNQSLYLARME